MRYLFAVTGLILLLVASATAGSFKAEMDLDTYVDAGNAGETFTDSDTLWASSLEGEPVKEVYLSFINNFGTVGIFKPDQIESAALTIYAIDVETPGKIMAYLVEGATLEAAWDDKPEYDTDVSTSLDVDSDGMYIIDITPLIKKAVQICVEGCPYSIVLVAEDNASIGFASMESAEEKAILKYFTSD